MSSLKFQVIPPRIAQAEEVIQASPDHFEQEQEGARRCREEEWPMSIDHRRRVRVAICQHEREVARDDQLRQPARTEATGALRLSEQLDETASQTRLSCVTMEAIGDSENGELLQEQSVIDLLVVQFEFVQLRSVRRKSTGHLCK